MPTEIITRRHLPHWYVPGAMHFITYRLYGTIPPNVLTDLRTRRAQLLKTKPSAGQNSSQHREQINKQIFAAYDNYLDNCCKIDWLKNPALAAMIRANLYHHNHTMFHLLVYCVMPNLFTFFYSQLDSTHKNWKRPNNRATGRMTNAARLPASCTA